MFLEHLGAISNCYKIIFQLLENQYLKKNTFYYNFKKCIKKPKFRIGTVFILRKFQLFWAKLLCLSFVFVKRGLNHGSKGIRLWPSKWCTLPIMIHVITLSVGCNKRLKRLDTQRNEPTNQNSILSPKLLSQAFL